MITKTEENGVCFKDFADKVAIGLLLIDAQGSCILANKFWLQISGYSEKDIIGNGWLESMSLASRESFQRQLTFALHRESGFETEVQIATPDGLVKWFDLRVNQDGYPKDGESRFVIVASEVTDQKGNELNLRKFEERYKNIINRASDFVFEVSPNGRFTFANPATYKTLGYTEKEIVGLSCLEIVPIFMREQVANFYQEQFESLQPTSYYEMPVLTKSGKKLWLGQNTTLTITNGKVVGAQGVAREITEQKLADRAKTIQDSTVRILTESNSEDLAIGRILESFSTTLDYQVASWWRAQEAHDGVSCRIFWSEKNGAYQEFEHINSVLALKRGEEIPGLILDKKRSIWKSDLFTTKAFLREKAARKCGLASGFWVPVFVDGKVYGVFEFLYSRHEPIDNDLLQLIINVASQFGQFVKRHQAELEVEEGIARKVAILDSAMDCIISINHRGEIIDFNPAAQRTFGYEEKEAIGLRMGDIVIPEEGRAEHFAGLEEYLRKGSSPIMHQRFEIIGQRKNGEKFPLEVVIEPIHSQNSMPIFTSYLRDITEQKNWELELKNAKENAEAASLAKSQFLAVMSHEIRTPLNAIIGLGEIAASTDSDNERKELASIIHQNSEFLLTLINDVLDFSKIEADHIVLEKIEFDLVDLAENIAEIFAVKAFSKGIEFVCSLDSKIQKTYIGDSVRLRQVIMNLVSNAIKFTEEGVVSLEIHVAELNEQFSKLEFVVTDTGIGIPDDQIKAIFEKFNQADASTSRKYGGTGLGLSISQSLVKLMGSEITVEKTGFGGSRFRFEIDLPTVETTKAYELSEELKDKSVLIAETSSVALEAVRKAFDDSNAEIFGATQVFEFHKAVEKRKFDLVLVDQAFGGRSNDKFFSKIRDLVGEDTTILELSSDRSAKVKVSDFSCVIFKPFRKKSIYLSALIALGIVTENPNIDSNEEFGGIEARHARILLAEDNPANQDLAKRLLSKFDYTIDIANNGTEAVRMSLENDYDLILMDIEMPEKDGFQATKEIRERESERRIPIIALTAHAIAGYRTKCLEAGMDEYLTKPLRRDLLVKTIQDALAMRLSEEPIVAPNSEATEKQESESNGDLLVYIDHDIFDLAEKYIVNSQTVVDQLRELINNRDFDAVKRVGHNFKGSGSGYGIETISELGNRIELLGEERNSEDLFEAVEKLEKYLKNVRIESKIPNLVP